MPVSPMVLERLLARPDVEAAGLTTGLPFASGFGDAIRVPGRETIPQLKGGGPVLNVVTAEYFRTVGTRIVRGRPFTVDDRAGTAPVAIVDETMAATLWPNEEAIGKCFVVGRSPACAEIVGVAADTRRFKLREDEAMAFYIPFGQEQGIGGTQLLVRPRGDARRVLAAVKQELAAMDETILFVNTARPANHRRRQHRQTDRRGARVRARSRDHPPRSQAGEHQAAQFALSKNGTLRLSPDGGRIALSTLGRDREIWTYSLARRTLTRLAVPGRVASQSGRRTANGLPTPAASRAPTRSTSHAPTASARRSCSCEKNRISWPPRGAMTAATCSTTTCRRGRPTVRDGR